MSNRRLYPTNRTDRLLLWSGLVAIPLTPIILKWGLLGKFDWLDLIIIPLGMFAFWFCVYLIQERPHDEFGDYTTAIVNIEKIGKQLLDLVVFLKAERQKVEAAEATLTKLRDEETQLESVVGAKRETVEAILSASMKATATTTAARVWKERGIGFISGLLASLLATVVFDYFTR